MLGGVNREIKKEEDGRKKRIIEIQKINPRRTKIFKKGERKNEDA